MGISRKDRTQAEDTLDRLLTAVEDALDTIWESGEGHAAFRDALLALDREVTGGRLPGLVSWMPAGSGAEPESLGVDLAVLAEPHALLDKRQIWLYQHEFLFEAGYTLGQFAYDHAVRVLAYLPLRVEDALPAGAESEQPEAEAASSGLPPGVEIIRLSPEDLKACWAAHRGPLLPCGHPAACDGLAGEGGDRPGCGWCADIADNAMLIDHLSRTYSHFTDGRISKPNTLPEEVFALADDLATEEVEQAVREALQEGDGIDAPNCECGLPDCGPATRSDSEGVPLCERCASELAKDPRNHLADCPCPYCADLGEAKP